MIAVNVCTPVSGAILLLPDLVYKNNHFLWFFARGARMAATLPLRVSLIFLITGRSVAFLVPSSPVLRVHSRHFCAS